MKKSILSQTSGSFAVFLTNVWSEYAPGISYIFHDAYLPNKRYYKTCNTIKQFKISNIITKQKQNHRKIKGILAVGRYTLLVTCHYPRKKLSNKIYEQWKLISFIIVIMGINRLCVCPIILQKNLHHFLINFLVINIPMVARELSIYAYLYKTCH